MNSGLFSKNILFLLVFFILLLYNLFLRYFTFNYSTIDWDEITYIVMGKGILNGYIPYVDLWDLKPPGIYLIYTLTIPLFGYSIECIRINSLLFVTLLSFSIFLHLFKFSKILAVIGSIYISYLFILYPSGLSGNTEIFFLSLECLGLYFFLQNNYKKTMFGSILLGVAFLVKYIIIFDLIAFYLYKLVIFKNFKKKDLTKYILFRWLPLTFIFCIPLLCIISYFLIIDHLREFLESIISTSSKHSGINSIEKRIASLIHFYFVYIVQFLFLYIILKINKQKFIFIPKTFLFLIWIITSSLGAVFTGFLYDHYFLAILPPIVLFLYQSLAINLEQLIKYRYTASIRMTINIVVYSFLFIIIFISSIYQEKKLNKILRNIPDTSKIISEIVIRDGGGSIFISSGYHTPYVILNQLPPIKYIQPNNYNETIFANNFSVDISSIVNKVESNDIKYIQWCNDFLPEDILNETRDLNTYNYKYYSHISELIIRKYFLFQKVEPNCSLFKLNSTQINIDF